MPRNWALLLAEYSEAKELSTDASERRAAELNTETMKLLNAEKNNDPPTIPPLSSANKESPQSIPTFFEKKIESANKECDETQSLLHDLAREQLLDMNEENLLTESDLDQLYTNLNTLLTEYGETEYMTYEIFRELKVSLPERTHLFFTPTVYRLFCANTKGKILAKSFFQFVTLGVNALHQYITLARYDALGNGYLTEPDLEVFISDQIEMIPSLSRIEEAFHPYYVYHAVRKFMFTLDSRRKNKISILRLLSSNVFQEFNRFRFESDTSNRASFSNWFSPQTAMRIYKLYLELDSDHNGTLSRSEMIKFNGSSISNLCVNRLFQVKRTWDGELDYKGFLDFVLAVENKKSLASFQYFWEIIDLDHKLYLNPLDIHTLFRSVQKKMGLFGLDTVDVNDVMSEIIDMVHPKDDTKITKQELIDSKIYGTVVDILTDVKGFWEYDNREAMIVSDDNE